MLASQTYCPHVTLCKTHAMRLYTTLDNVDAHGSAYELNVFCALSVIYSLFGYNMNKELLLK